MCETVLAFCRLIQQGGSHSDIKMSHFWGEEIFMGPYASHDVYTVQPQREDL